MIDPIENNLAPIKKYEQPELVVLYTDLVDLPEPVRKPVIAVYPNTFKDETGQRRSNSTYATFSTAITQAPHSYLIRVLKHSGFFEVVERVALEAVSKERQLIRSTRDTFDEDQKLMPLVFVVWFCPSSFYFSAVVVLNIQLPYFHPTRYENLGLYFFHTFPQ